jgi:hypothetical protein
MNAVAAVNAPLAYAAFVATYLPILADSAVGDRFPQDDPLAAMSL